MKSFYFCWILLVPISFSFSQETPKFPWNHTLDMPPYIYNLQEVPIEPLDGEETPGHQTEIRDLGIDRTYLQENFKRTLVVYTGTSLEINPAFRKTLSSLLYAHLKSIEQRELGIIFIVSVAVPQTVFYKLELPKRHRQLTQQILRETGYALPEDGDELMQDPIFKSTYESVQKNFPIYSDNKQTLWKEVRALHEEMGEKQRLQPQKDDFYIGVLDDEGYFMRIYFKPDPSSIQLFF